MLTTLVKLNWNCYPFLCVSQRSSETAPDSSNLLSISPRSAWFEFAKDLNTISSSWVSMQKRLTFQPPTSSQNYWEGSHAGEWNTERRETPWRPPLNFWEMKTREWFRRTWFPVNLLECQSRYQVIASLPWQLNEPRVAFPPVAAHSTIRYHVTRFV